MTIGLSGSVDKSQSGGGMAAWLAKLQEGKKSLVQMQTEMIQGTTETIKEMQDKSLQAAKDKAAEGEAEKTGDVEKTADEIKTPSEVTAADLQSPIDIKL